MLRVRFSGILRQVAGCAQAEAPLPASGQLGDLLSDLEARYPGVLGQSAEVQWRHGSSHVVVTVNGKVVSEDRADGGNVRLADGDVVELVAPLGGG